MTAGREAVICAGVRTPRGKGSARGGLHAVAPVDLVATLLGVLAERGVRKADDVLLGCATQVDAQGANLARTATLVAGWDADVPGATINRFCASGLDAVAMAAARVRAGDANTIVAGGVESVSRVPVFADRGPLYADPAVAARVGTIHMGVAADLVATLDGVSRDALEDYAERTRAKARAAWASGAAAASVVAIGGLARDELVDYAPTRAELAAQPALFAELGAGGQDAVCLARYPAAGPAIRHVHARGTSPALADAAAVMVVAERAAAERAGMRPRARVVATATCAADPVIMLTAGQLAAERALAKAGLAPPDIEVFSFAEAFAALCLRFMRELDVGHDRLNPNGGTMALGHAFGATGAILVLDVVDELARRGARYGVAAVSGAAGLGAAAVLERID
jgi:acetyl-CoA C-acetyltransferase